MWEFLAEMLQLTNAHVYDINTVFLDYKSVSKGRLLGKPKTSAEKTNNQTGIAAKSEVFSS